MPALCHCVYCVDFQRYLDVYYLSCKRKKKKHTSPPSLILLVTEGSGKPGRRHVRRLHQFLLELVRTFY